MQLETAITMLTIQAIENPDEKLKCLKMIDILSLYAHKYNLFDVEFIINNICTTVKEDIKLLSANLDFNYILKQETINNLEKTLTNLQFINNFGVSKFISSQNKKELSKEITTILETGKIEYRISKQKIQQCIEYSVLPKLDKINANLHNDTPFTYLLKNSPNRQLQQVQNFIKLYNSSFYPIQTSAIINLNSCINNIIETQKITNKHLKNETSQQIFI